MSAKFYISGIEHIEALKAHMARIPSMSEDIANRFLHDTAAPAAQRDITSVIPVSNRNYKTKKHAKTSNPLEIDEKNLGFAIRARGGAANKKGSFGYLVFPNEGIGPHNLFAHEFFQGGLDRASDDFIPKLINTLVQKIQEAI